MTDLLAGKQVLVTGAGSGIGAATARLFAGMGARIAVGYHSNNAGAEALVGQLPGTGHLALRTKIDDPESLTKSATTLHDRFGHLDCLVNSAGNTTRISSGDLDCLTDEVFDDLLRTNLRGTFSAIRAFLPLLRAAPEGASIINLGSLASSTGVGSNLAYVASKGGLLSLSKGLARVLGPQIRVLTVSPAGVDTDFVKGRDPTLLERQAGGVPLQKATSADDVALAVLACAALLTSSTGIEVIVDEGRHLSGWPLNP